MLRKIYVTKDLFACAKFITYLVYKVTQIYNHKADKQRNKNL